MKKSKLIVLEIIAALVMVGCATVKEKTVIKIDGSSTVFPVTEAVAEEFQAHKKNAVHVTVGISGTGGGFKKFCRGELDISDASRPILKSEMEVCRQAGIQYIEIPVCFDALTVAVNPSNQWASSMTIAELKKLWEPAAQGVITKWNQIRPEWPNEPIKLFGAGSDSGTFDYFTEAVVGKAKSSRGDYTASEDDNTLVQGITADKYALGYLPFAYYEPNQQKLKAVGIDDGKGAVLPSVENVANGTYQPFSRPLFLYVSVKAIDRPEVKEFVEFYLNNVMTLAEQVKYLPLSPTAYQLGKDRFQKKQAGTAFGGLPKVGVTAEQILQMTPQS